MDIKQILLAEMTMWQKEFVLLFKKRIENTHFQDCLIYQQDWTLFVGCPSKTDALGIKRVFFQVAQQVQQSSLSAIVTWPGGNSWQIPSWMHIQPNPSVLDDNVRQKNEIYYLDEIGSRQSPLTSILNSTTKNPRFQGCEVTIKNSIVFVHCPKESVAEVVKKEIFQAMQKLKKVPLWAILIWPEAKSYETIAWMTFQPQDSVIHEKDELWDLPEFPPEFRGCLVKISQDGLVLELTRKIGKEEKIAISQEAEWFLEFLADEWGSVCLKWEGYFKIFGAKIISSDARLGGGVKVMSESSSLINPDNFDRLLRAHRIFGSAMSGIDYPLLKALEKMVESEYPCTLITLEDTKQIWINDKMLEQGLEVDVQEGVGRYVTDHWLPGDLEELVRNIALCDTTKILDWSYQATIFPPKWGKFRSSIQRVESIVGDSRLTIIREFEEIPRPLR